MESFDRADLTRVFLENDYHFLRAWSARTVEFSRTDSESLTVTHVRVDNVKSLSHLIAHQMGIGFETYPPSEPEISRILSTYRVEMMDVRALLEAFRSKVDPVVTPAIADDAARALDLGPVRWAALLENEWNDMLGCCRTDDTYIILSYSNSA